MSEALQELGVPNDAVVAVVSSQLPREHLLLDSKVGMPMPFAPPRNLFE